MPIHDENTIFTLPADEPVAVVSDLHGNADAFGAVVDELYRLQNHRGLQQVVVLGDLFTYGVQPQRIVEQVLQLADHFGVWLVVGNHDEWYFDALEGSGPDEDKPDWILETVDWTRRRLDGSGVDELDDQSLWHDSLAGDALLLSHANPFGRRDWTYLNDDASRRRALEVIEQQGRRVGVFGHTHRRCAVCAGDDGALDNADPFGLLDDELTLKAQTWLLNPGSVGQPRSRRPISSFLILWGDDDRLMADFRANVYGVDQQVDAIRRTDLSADTKARLIGYLQ